MSFENLVPGEKSRIEEMSKKDQGAEIPADGTKVGGIDLQKKQESIEKKGFDSSTLESTKSSVAAIRNNEMIARQMDHLPSQPEMNLAFNDFPPRTVESAGNSSGRIEGISSNIENTANA